MRRRDLIVVGGGIAGASLAAVMARAGFDVSILEKTRAIRDENRGELLWPWGVREAQTLGLFDVLLAAGGHVVPWQRNYSDVNPGTPSMVDLTTMIEGVPGSLNLGHPKARQALLDAAKAAGAEVVRGSLQTATSTRCPSPNGGCPRDRLDHVLHFHAATVG